MAMSDLKLQGFAVRAEERMPLPDFAELDRRGRVLHRRRVTAVAGVAAACVIAAVGVVVLRDDSPKAVQPVHPPDDTSVQAMDYPGPVMEDLDPGRYALIPSSDPDFPRARISLPSGWNAWEGPNRFGGQESTGSNEEGLGESDWYVGILVVKVIAVTTRPCHDSSPNMTVVGSSPESLVRAIRRIRGYQMTESTEPLATFGHPATHFRLIATGADGTCDDNLFTTSANGVVGGTEDTEDVWVVDVDGYPVLVDSQLTAKTPPAVQRDLSDAIDSIEFYFEE
jgi:hypothetical protein